MYIFKNIYFFASHVASVFLLLLFTQYAHITNYAVLFSYNSDNRILIKNVIPGAVS